MDEVREHYERQLQGLHELNPYEELPVIGGGPIRIAAHHSMKCVLRQAEDGELPPTWGGRIYEEIIWPPRDISPGQESHPFRLFLEFSRGDLTVTWPIHDMEKDPWLGPTFKATPIRTPLPINFKRRMKTFLVFGDKLKDQSLCQWITVLLAQRELLTQEEEEAAVTAFFLTGNHDLSVAQLRAYRRLKAKFVQPTGGRPSLPALYRKTLWWRERESPERHAHKVEFGPYLSLKSLRFREPNLYRALLDRINRSRIKVHVWNGEKCVLLRDADAVDEERSENALARRPGRFHDHQGAWIDQLVAHGTKRASAKRKVKRWCSDLRLSREDIQASIEKNRLVRLNT